MRIVYVEEWVQELCQRGYLRAYDVPEGVDYLAPDFDPRAYELNDEDEVFLGATDCDMPDPQNHPGHLSVAPQETIEAMKDRIGHGTINIEAIQQDDSGHRTP